MNLNANGYGLLIGWTLWLIILFAGMETLELLALRTNKGMFLMLQSYKCK
jgi:hypothetical protein